MTRYIHIDDSIVITNDDHDWNVPWLPTILDKTNDSIFLTEQQLIQQTKTDALLQKHLTETPSSILIINSISILQTFPKRPTHRHKPITHPDR